MEAPDQESWINAIGTKLAEIMRAEIEKRGAAPTSRQVNRTVCKLVTAQSRALFNAMVEDQTAPNAWDAETAGFEKRNIARWKPAFRAYEKLWHAVHEVTAEFDRYHRPMASEGNDFLFESLSSLNARALLIARECMALMRAGFAEGALARWRALHEVSVIAIFLSEANQEIAYRYLLSFRFQSYKAALQIDEHIGKGTSDSFSDDELREIKLYIEKMIAEHGVDLSHEYEWARAGLGDAFPKKKRISFADIEEATGKALKRMLADAMLDNVALKDLLGKKW